jgi:hypothetical protein
MLEVSRGGHGLYWIEFPPFGTSAEIAECGADAVGIVDDDLGGAVDLAERQLPGRAADTDGGEHPAGDVVDRRADAAQSGLVLALVERVAARAGQCQVPPQGGGVGEGGVASG